MMHDEFSINLSWHRKGQGSFPRPVPDVDGFYLDMGWANEGLADHLARDKRVSPESVVKIARFIAAEVGTPLEAGESMVVSIPSQAAKGRNDRLTYLKAARKALGDELELLEKESP